MKTIRVDDDVWKKLQKLASAFEDTPNTVLRRVFKLNRQRNGSNGTPRAPRGEKTPEGAFRQPILDALYEAGGSAKAADVLKRVEATMGSKLNAIDRQTLTTGALRWRNTAQWERNNLVEEGLLKKNSSRGMWELTTKGVSAAEALK